MLDRLPGMHEQPLNPPANGRLKSITVPALVIVGSREVPELQTLADRLGNEIPNARKAVIPGAAHMSNMERPVEAAGGESGETGVPCQTP